MLAAGVATIALASCAAPSRSFSTNPEHPLPPTLERLITRADLERSGHRTSRSIEISSTDEWPASVGEARPADAASDPLEAAVLACAGEPLPERKLGPLNDEALKRYAAGRAALLAGDSAAAVAEFNAAHLADPAAPEPLRDLGEAHLVRGEYVEAISAFEKALERDPHSRRALEQVGRHALRTGDAPRAATLLSRAWQVADADADPVERSILAFELGKSLASVGRSLAGAQAMLIAAQSPDNASSARWAEHAALIRQRPDLLRAAGDLFAKSEHWPEARAAFDRSFALAQHTAIEGLAERRVIASLRCGAPAGATQAIVEACLGRSLNAQPGKSFRASPDTLALIRRTAAAVESRPTLADALASAADTLAADDRARWASDIALAVAAAQRPRAAMHTLRQRVNAAPGDARALDALIDRGMESSVDDAVRLASEWTHTRPEAASNMATSLLRAAPSFETARASLESMQAGRAAESGRALLLATLLLPIMPAQAEMLAQRAAELASNPWPARCIQVQSLVIEGRLDEARRAADAIPADTPYARLAKARALAAIGSPSEALTTLAPDLAAEAPADLSRLIHAAEWAIRADDPAYAERLLHRAIAAFPHSTEAYEALIASLLMRRPQAREEAEEITMQVRDAANSLREVAPWSDALQKLLARDLLSQRQWSEAASRLKPVLDRHPGDRESLAMLLAAAKQANQLNDFEPWIAGVSARRPDLSAWLVARAFVLTESDRTSEAADLLHTALTERPHDNEASRALEDLYRTRLGNAARADALALVRLARTPATPEARIDRAEVLLRARRLEEARAEIEAVLADAVPREALLLRLVNLGLAASAAVESEAAAPPDALAILDTLITSLPNAPEALHRRHIVALTRAGASLDRIRNAADKAASRHVSLAGDAYLLALDELVRARRPADALALARDAASPPNEPRPSLLASWILLAVSAHDGESAEAACRASFASLRVPEIFAALAQIAPALRTDSPHFPDELAYLIASAFGAMGLEDQADRLYSLALEKNPDHAWSNNNLGYRWLDQGHRFADAYWMIARAFRDLPDDPAVIDSMGWARYRAGIFVDAPAAQDSPALEGAVTLLQRAADAMADRPDPEVLEHLGDALFHAHRPDDARRAWERALSLTRMQQAQLEAAPNISVDAIAAIRDRAERLHLRLDALANDREPPTADRLGDGREPPRPPDRRAGPVS